MFSTLSIKASNQLFYKIIYVTDLDKSAHLYYFSCLSICLCFYQNFEKYTQRRFLTDQSLSLKNYCSTKLRLAEAPNTCFPILRLKWRVQLRSTDCRLFLRNHNRSARTISQCIYSRKVLDTYVPM